MEECEINSGKALSLRKAGYRLLSIIDGKQNLFLYVNNEVFVSDGNKERRISPYLFLSLYEKNLFFIHPNDEEETVDKKKDEEYYSWRQ